MRILPAWPSCGLKRPRPDAARTRRLAMGTSSGPADAPRAWRMACGARGHAVTSGRCKPTKRAACSVVVAFALARPKPDSRHMSDRGLCLNPGAHRPPARARCGRLRPAMPHGTMPSPAQATAAHSRPTPLRFRLEPCVRAASLPRCCRGARVSSAVPHHRATCAAQPRRCGPRMHGRRPRRRVVPRRHREQMAGGFRGRVCCERTAASYRRVLWSRLRRGRGGWRESARCRGRRKRTVPRDACGACRGRIMRRAVPRRIPFSPPATPSHP